MTVRKVWLGSVGPYLYNDTDLIGDSDGDLAGMMFAGLSTTGQLHVGEAPSVPDNVIRQGDVGAAAFQPYIAGTVALTPAGLTTTPTITAQYAKIGRLATLVVPGFSGTSNATTFSLGILPASLLPVISPVMPISGIDNGVNGFKVLVISGGGTLLLQNVLGSNTSWTASGTKGIFAITISYITAT